MIVFSIKDRIVAACSHDFSDIQIDPYENVSMLNEEKAWTPSSLKVYAEFLLYMAEGWEKREVMKNVSKENQNQCTTRRKQKCIGIRMGH